MKPYFDLVKFGIVKLVVITGALGYALGLPFEEGFYLLHFLMFVLALASLSGGSLALNSYQEWELDSLMSRTQNRPIPSKQISPQRALYLSVFLILLGLVVFYYLQPLSALIGLVTLFLYNYVYTELLKQKSAFAAVPGAIPGAAPVLLGFSVVNDNIFSSEAVYVFLLMFLWQMPHFWALAIRYADDYAKGGFPVLPVTLGKKRTLYHMGLYIFPYIALALMSPWFVDTGVFYLCLVLPLSFIAIIEFYKFLEKAEKNWVRFFIWINLSMVGFLAAPVLDRWFFYIHKGILRN